jgi:hypothetical protein
LIIQSREYQLIAGKVVAGTQLRVTAGRMRAESQWRACKHLQ